MEKFKKIHYLNFVRRRIVVKFMRLLVLFYNFMVFLSGVVEL